MKKTLICSLLLGAAAALTGNAQTNFRHITFDEATKAAQTENKLIFIDFFTDWCGPCRQMATKVFPQENVGQFMNEKFVALKLDAEKEGAELSKKYGVTAFPTYVIINPANREVVAKFSGSMPADDFIATVGNNLNPEMTPARIAERYLGGERTPELVNAYALIQMKNKKEDEGFAVVNDYFNSLSNADRLKAANGFLFTRYTVDMDNDRFRFMLANYDKFENAPAIKDQLAQLYRSEFNRYFSGYMYRQGKFNQETYNQLKKDATMLGFADEYKNAFDFIEKRVATSNEAEYFAFCKDRFNSLNPREKDLVMLNLTRLVDAKTPELKKEMSQFIRGQLATCSPISIQFAGRILSGLEE